MITQQRYQAAQTCPILQRILEEKVRLRNKYDFSRSCREYHTFLFLLAKQASEEELQQLKQVFGLFYPHEQHEIVKGVKAQGT